MAASDKPRVAVLIPAYNAERTIDKALRSLASNDEPHHVIIVDDGSLRSLTGAILPRPGLHILQLRNNVGITRALNHGLEYILSAGYEFVARLDADDVALPDRLALQRAFLEKHPDVMVVGSWGEVVTERGEPLFFLNHPTDHDAISRKLYHNNCFLHPSLMIRAQAFREAGLYSEAYPSAEDYELLVRLAKRYRLANLPQYLIKYTHAKGGISIGKRRQLLASRLKIQWRYRNWRHPDFYVGIGRTLVLRLVSVEIISWVKRKRSNYRRMNVSSA